MIHSIQQFATEGVKNISNIFSSYTNDMTKIAEMVYGVTDEVTRLGCRMIAEEWESYDEMLRKRKDLRRGWYIVRRRNQGKYHLQRAVKSSGKIQSGLCGIDQ